MAWKTRAWARGNGSLAAASSSGRRSGRGLRRPSWPASCAVAPAAASHGASSSRLRRRPPPPSARLAGSSARRAASARRRRGRARGSGTWIRCGGRCRCRPPRGSAASAAASPRPRCAAGSSRRRPPPSPRRVFFAAAAAARAAARRFFGFSLVLALGSVLRLVAARRRGLGAPRSASAPRPRAAPRFGSAAPRPPSCAARARRLLGLALGRDRRRPASAPVDERRVGHAVEDALDPHLDLLADELRGVRRRRREAVELPIAGVGVVQADLAELDLDARRPPRPAPSARASRERALLEHDEVVERDALAAGRSKKRFLACASISASRDRARADRASRATCAFSSTLERLRPRAGGQRAQPAARRRPRPTAPR